MGRSSRRKKVRLKANSLLQAKEKKDSTVAQLPSLGRPTLPAVDQTVGHVAVAFELCDDMDINLVVSGFDTAVTLKDVTGRISAHSEDAKRFGLYEWASKYRKQGDDVVKLTQKTGSKIYGGQAGISVPADSTMEIETDGEISGGTHGIEERDRSIESAIAIKIQTLSASDRVEILAALRHVQTADERTDVVRKSKIWPLIKEYGPDAVGLFLKIINQIGEV